MDVQAGAALDLIPEAVRRQAEEAWVLGPEPPPELGAERVVTPYYTVLVSPMPSVNLVQRVKLRRDRIEATVAEVRDLLRARGRTQAAWHVGPSSTPEGLAPLLGDLGMTPYSDPPLESSSSCMALVQPPVVSEMGRVVVELADTLAAFEAGEAIVAEAFGMGAEDRHALQSKLETRLRLQRENRTSMRVYLASIDGVAVGTGQASLLDDGINLAGAAVLPSARGQGVYRALVAARWQEAVARGTPALTVQAGVKSRPILERLGFVTVATVDVLCDRF